MEWNEIKGREVRCFRLGEEPEVFYLIKIRDNEYMAVHDDAYTLKTGNVEFLSKESLLEKYNIDLGSEENERSPYCPVCDSCGEDGCCPATSCEQDPRGHYCETYLKELKFGYIMYHDILKIVDGDPKYDDQISKVSDENWDRLFLDKTGDK